MRTFVSLLCILAFGSLANAESKPLFDGKTLEGWTVENEAKIEIQDGVLLLKDGNGWLRSNHVYGDFQLHLEWKALKAEKYDALTPDPANGADAGSGGN